MIKYSVPESIVVLANKLEPKAKNRLLAIGHHLYLHQINSYNFHDLEFNMFSLSSKWMQKKFPAIRLKSGIKGYNWFLNLLMKEGIIEADMSEHSKDKKSYCNIKTSRGVYCCHYKILNLKEVQVEIKDKAMEREVMFDHSNMSTDVLKWIAKTMDKVVIDEKAVQFTLQEVMNAEAIQERTRNKIEMKLACGGKEPNPENLLSVQAHIDRVLINLDRIKKKNVRYTVSEKVKRLYSSLTNLKKEFRDCLILDGEKLVNLDFKNSQPAIYANLMFPEVRRQFKEELANFSNVKWPSVIQTKDFIKATQDGSYYDEMAKSLDISRSLAKLLNMKYFFGAGNNCELIDSYLKNKYPIVHKLMNDLKQSNKQMGYNSYKEFACLLQRIEVHIIFEKIGKKLLEEKIPFLTIHDSIMVKESDKLKTFKIMSDALEEITVKIKIEVEQ